MTAPREWLRYGADPARRAELLHAHLVRHVYERHAHEELALGATEAGVQAFAYRGGYHASTPGTVIVLLPGEPHDGRAGVPDGFTYRMVYLATDRVHEELADIAGRPAVVPRVAEPLLHDPELFRLTRRLHAALDGAAAALERDDLLARTLGRLARHGGTAPPEPPAANPRAVARARDLLHARFRDDLTVAELAAEAGLTRFHLSRLFQRSFGLPPHAYQLQLRLAEAKRLLAAGESAAGVAAAAGFADQAHLTRRFKGAFGVTPARYQRTMREAGGRLTQT